MPAEIRQVQQAFRFALDPTPRQARILASHAGGARFAYNWGHQEILAALAARATEQAAAPDAIAARAAVDAAQLVFEESARLGREAQLEAEAALRRAQEAAADVMARQQPATTIPSDYDLCKQWRTWRDEHANDPEPAPGERRTNTAWVAENSKAIYEAALRDVSKAWRDYFKSAKGRRRGRRLGRPRFHKKGRCRESFQLHGQALRVIGADGIAQAFRASHVDPGSRRYMVVLPKIGPVFLAESARKLRRRVDRGQARIVRGTVSRDSGGRWHISLTTQVAREIRTGPSARQRAGGVTGIDLGVRDTVTLADGTRVQNPAPLESHLRRLARAQRAVARRTRRGEPSSRRRAKAVRRVGRIHSRIAALRLDHLEKLSTGLVHSYEGIGVEGWDVREAAQHGSEDLPRRVRRDRNRQLLGSGLGMLRRKLEHKGSWYGCQVKVTTAHSATGRTCSRCEQVRTTPVPPSDELFSCPSCGWAGDRRVNSALVLARFAREEMDAASGAESLNARGGDVSPAAAREGGGRRSLSKREPAPGPGLGETGTPGR